MKQFFQNDEGQYSMMRLIVFLMAIAGIGCAIAGMSPTLVGILVGAATTGKGFQKIGERKK